MFVKKLAVLFIFCLAVLSANSAEYIVKKGDCLSLIAKKINYSIADLMDLNNLRSPLAIYPGQKILYVTQKDLGNALCWAKKRQKDLASSNNNYGYFVWVEKDIKACNIRYAIDRPNGTHASLILAFSKAWEVEGKKSN